MTVSGCAMLDAGWSVWAMTDKVKMTAGRGQGVIGGGEICAAGVKNPLSFQEKADDIGAMRRYNSTILLCLC